MKAKLLVSTAFLAASVSLSAQKSATITVHADQGKEIIPKEIYGQFAEHLGSCIYGGLWVGENSDIPNIKGYRTDVFNALKDLSVPVLRWPGGCFADEYHWMDGIGPKENRPKMVNNNWGGTIEDNSFGTHEFLNLCEMLGCEPYISGNVGSGTVEELAKWVEYMTSDGDSPMANLRRKNGRDKAWKVKYLGVGNESWGCGGSMRPEYYADLYRRYFRNGRLIVLVDEYTASASEIVSGAVQDWDRGIIVGRRSFGKGLVQRPIDLPDGSMIRLTIARYYTPAGRCIQKPYDSSTDYNKDLIERFNHGELMNADSIHFPDSLKVQTKKLGRTVYGGGGIMPDYFVPIDTTLYTDYHRNLVAKGVVIKFTMKFIEGHRKELAGKYKKFESFNEKFIIDDDMMATLREMGDKEGVKFNEEQYQKSLPLIKTQLKALIARDLWDMNEYFQVMNTTNESIQKALEILNSDEYQKKLKVNQH